MPRQSARYKLQLEARGDAAARVPVPEAVKLIKSMAALRPQKKDYKGLKKPKGFDQTVELVCWLGVDPRQADQALRGAVSLPKGIGKSKRVIAFCPDDLADKAKAAGAVEAGADELIKRSTTVGPTSMWPWLIRRLWVRSASSAVYWARKVRCPRPSQAR